MTLFTTLDQPKSVKKTSKNVQKSFIFWQNPGSKNLPLWVLQSARIVFDVLPSQASSVPCERLFSGSKQIAIDRQACLGSKVFEELVIMGSAWRPASGKPLFANFTKIICILLKFSKMSSILSNLPNLLNYHQFNLHTICKV